MDILKSQPLNPEEKRAFASILDSLFNMLESGLTETQKVKLIGCFPELLENTIALLPNQPDYQELKDKLQGLLQRGKAESGNITYDDEHFKVGMRKLIHFLRDLDESDDSNLMPFFCKYFSGVFLKIHDDIMAGKPDGQRMFRERFQDQIDFSSGKKQYGAHEKTGKAKIATVEVFREDPVSSDGEQVIFKGVSIAERVKKSNLYIGKTHYNRMFERIKTLDHQQDKVELEVLGIENGGKVKAKVYLLRGDQGQDVLWINHPEQKLIVDFGNPLSVYANKQVRGSGMTITARNMVIDGDDGDVAGRNINTVTGQKVRTTEDFHLGDTGSTGGSSGGGSGDRDGPTFGPNFPFGDSGTKFKRKNSVSGSGIVSGGKVTIGDRVEGATGINALDGDDVEYIQMRLGQYIRGRLSEVQFLAKIDDEFEKVGGKGVYVEKFGEDTCVIMKTSEGYIVIGGDVKSSTITAVTEKYRPLGNTLVSHFKSSSPG